MVDDPEIIYVPPVLENPIRPNPGEPEEDPTEVVVPLDMEIIDEGEVLEVPEIETGPHWEGN